MRGFVKALTVFALLGFSRLQGQTPGAGLQPPLTGKSLPTFSAAGIQSNIAPSGYSDGAEEEARQTASLVVDLRDANVIDGLPIEDRFGCDRQAELLHAALAQSNSFEANRRLGLFYLQHRNPVLSEKYLAAARDSRPSDAAVTQYLATAELEANEYAASGQLASQLIKLNPANAGAHRLMGSVEAAAGQAEAALAEYKLSVRLDASANNVFASALSMMAHGFIMDAERVLAAATMAHPESARLWAAAGIVDILRGNQDRAIDALLRSAALDPTDGLAPTLLAALTRNAETGVRTLPVLQAFAAAKPKEAIAHYDYALVLSKVNEGSANFKARETIASELRAAIELQPKFAAAHFQLGVLYESLGNVRSAIGEFSQAVSRQPDVAQWRYRLARAYRSAGQISLADSEMARFKELDVRRDAGEDVSAQLIDGLPPDLFELAAQSCEARSAELYP